MFEDEEIVNINKVNFLQKKKSTFLLKTIKKYIKSFSKKNLPRNVKVIYYNKTSILVPSDLFDSKNSLNYLKYNTTIQIDDLTANDLILDEEINNLYIPDTEINNYIFEKFKAFDFYHYSSLILDKFSKEIVYNSSKKIYLNINDRFIDIIYFDNKKLIFYNSFDYSSNEDVLYYLLFTFSELNLDADKIHLVVCGLIDLESKLYELIYTYVRNVELIDFKKVEGIDSNILKSNILFGNF